MVGPGGNTSALAAAKCPIAAFIFGRAMPLHNRKPRAFNHFLAGRRRAAHPEAITGRKGRNFFPMRSGVAVSRDLAWSARYQREGC